MSLSWNEFKALRDQAYKEANYHPNHGKKR